MAAFDVVGVDLQLWLGIDFGVLGQEQVAVGLVRIGMLGIGMHHHLTVEHGARGAGQHALIELAALALRPGVVDARVVVDMLPPAGHVQPVERAFGALGVQPDLDVGPRQGAAQGEGTGGEAAAVLLVHIHAGNVKRLEALLLHLVMLDLRVTRGNDLGDAVGEISEAVHTHVVFHNADTAACFRHHEIARMGDQLRCRGDEQQVDRLVGRGACGQADISAIDHERGVQSGKAGRVVAHAAAKQRFHRLGRALQHGGEAEQFNPCWQHADARPLRLVVAVEEYHQVRAGQGERLDPRSQGLRLGVGLRRPCGKAAPLDRGHTGVFPVLMAQRRKPGLREVFPRLLAHAREPGQPPAGQRSLDAGELGKIVFHPGCAHADASVTVKACASIPT